MQPSRSRGTTLLPPRRGRGTLVQLGRSWGTLVRPRRTRLRWRGRGREPGRGAEGGDDPGPQRAVERGTGEVGRGHEREPLVGNDRAHEIDVGRGGPVEHRVGHRAEPDAAAVGLQREGGDQPGGQGEGFGGGGRRVRDVVAEGAGERQRPGHRPLLAVALLDGGVGHLEHARAPHHVPPLRPDRDDAVPLRAPHDLPVDVDLDEGGQGEQQVGRGGTGVGEQRGAVDARAQRQPDLGREPVRRVFRGRPDQPQDGRRVAAGQLGGRAGEVGDRRRRPVRGERHRTRRAHHPRLGGDGEHGREPDAEATDRARLVPLGRRAQRRERRHPRRGQRRAGVRDPQLGPPGRHRAARLPRIGAHRPCRRLEVRRRNALVGVRPRTAADSGPASLPSPGRVSACDPPRCAHRRRSRPRGVGVDERDPQPSRTPRGVGGVLGQLDEPRVGVTAEAQVLFGVGVLPEPGGRRRPRVEDGRAQRRGAEGVVHLHPDYSAGSKSTPSS